MPAIQANARNFLVNSDYPLDQVVYKNPGQLTVSAASFGTSVVAHGLPFTPLPQGNWSTQPDFAVSYEFGSGPPNPSVATSIYLYDVTVDALGPDVTVSVTNYSGSPVTIYYRVYAYQPSNVNLDVPHTNDADTYLLNTDMNYTKLFRADLFAQAAVSGAVAVPHSLGYYPQAAAWTEVSGVIRPIYQADPGISEVTCEVGTVSLIFTFVFPSAMNVHYRIWLDD
jgi:hypothetical protein